jgi:hypothetical protein
LNPYLFNIFIDDVTDYINAGNVHAPIREKMSIRGLLLADDLYIGLFALNGLHKGTDQVVKFCSDWNLKYNLKKTKILVLRKEKIEEGKIVYARSNNRGSR